MVKLHSTKSLKPPEKSSFFSPGMPVKKVCWFLSSDAHLFQGHKRAPGLITFKFMTQHTNFIDGEAYKALVNIMGGQIKDHSVQRCVRFLFYASHEG